MSLLAGTFTAFGWGAEPAQGEKWANVGDVAGAPFLKSPVLFPFNDAAVQTAPVGRYQPNAWAFFDLTGNVREWCSDCSGGYPALIADNPSGPLTGQSRTIRGGSWRSAPAACRAAARDRAFPETSADDLGFRVVQEE